MSASAADASPAVSEGPEKGELSEALMTILLGRPTSDRNVSRKAA